MIKFILILWFVVHARPARQGVFSVTHLLRCDFVVKTTLLIYFRGDTLIEGAPGATLRRNLTMMQGGEPASPSPRG